MKKFSSLAIAAILLLTTQRTALGQAGYPSAYANGGGSQNFNAYQNSGGYPNSGYQYGQPAPYGSYPSAGHRNSKAAYQRSLAMQQSVYQPTLTAMTLFQDGEVPVPPDADAIPSTGTFQPSDPTMVMPDAGGPIISSPDMTLPLYDDTTTWNAFAPPITSDPFVGQPGGDPYAPYTPYQQGIPPQGAYAYGANPANPYRFGWSSRLDASWLPNGNVQGVPAGAGITGGIDIVGVDYELTNTTQFVPGWILNWTNQFGWRNWSGPGGTLNLPSNVFRLGIDLELETPKSGPYSVSLGITPSINTDFDSGAFSEGFQLDARGILFMQLDQYWTLGLGAQYWDRVDSIVIPWAGLIYRDDYWEWQLMYPEARVSLFLGNETYWSKWLYVRAEYHVEAYGVNSTYGVTNTDNQVQLADKRLLLGLKMDAGLYSWIIEGGWVFDRDVDFDNTVPGFSLQDGFIGQIGLRY